MSRLHIILIFLTFIACEPIPKEPKADINTFRGTPPKETLTSKTRVVSYETRLDRRETACLDWKIPPKSELANIFDAMKAQEPANIQYNFYQFPCRIIGEVRYHGIRYNYSLNAGGFANLQRQDTSFYLGCESSDFEKYFITIKSSSSEVEAMLDR